MVKEEIKEDSSLEILLVLAILFAVGFWTSCFLINRYKKHLKGENRQEGKSMEVQNMHVSEKDKPFILALVSSGITILNIVITSIGAGTSNQLLTTTGMDILKFTFPTTTMAWAFYFSKSKKETRND